MSSAQGRGDEGISRGGELLASKWGEIKSSALPHVSWNAPLQGLLVVGSGGVVQRVRSRNLTQASLGRKRHCPHRCFFKSWQVGQHSKAGIWSPTR